MSCLTTLTANVACANPSSEMANPDLIIVDTDTFNASTITTTNGVITAFTLPVGKKFAKIEGRRASLKGGSDTAVPGDVGTRYKHTLSGIALNAGAPSLLQYAALGNGRFVAFAIFAAEIRVFGVRNGLYLSEGMLDPNLPDNSGGYAFTLASDDRSPEPDMHLKFALTAGYVASVAYLRDNLFT